MQINNTTAVTIAVATLKSKSKAPLICTVAYYKEPQLESTQHMARIS